MSQSSMNMNVRWLAWAGAGSLLLVPAVGMQFSDEVAWSRNDFLIFAGMLLGTGLGVELFLRRSSNRAYRLAGVITLVTAFLLVWVNGAVGIIGSEQHPANLLYFGVLGVGVVGAFASRLRASGLAWTTLLLAIFQTLVAVLAFVAAWGSAAPGWPWDTLVMTLIFTVLWLGAAWLFQRAARGNMIQ